MRDIGVKIMNKNSESLDANIIEQACADHCTGPGPKSCAKCAQGYEMHTEHGCGVSFNAVFFKRKNISFKHIGVIHIWTYLSCPIEYVKMS